MSYQYFSDAELACKCGCGFGSQSMNPEFMRKLIALREEAGHPFRVTSAFRCPEHNKAVSSTGEAGPHTTGHAIDIAVSQEQALWLVENARKFGMTGVGVSQKRLGRFIHVDDLAAPDYPRPTIWSY